MIITKNLYYKILIILSQLLFFYALTYSKTVEISEKNYPFPEYYLLFFFFNFYN